MSKRINYTNEPLKAEVVADFLPPPEQLVVREDGVKVTILLSRRSVDFFKTAAEQNHTSYQRMIRRLLDTYADRYRGDPDRASRSSGRSKAARRPT